MAASYTKHLCWSLFLILSIVKNFQSTYFEEHLKTAASENAFIKINHKENQIYIKKPRFFQHQHQKQVKTFAFIS